MKKKILSLVLLFVATSLVLIQRNTDDFNEQDLLDSSSIVDDEINNKDLLKDNNTTAVLSENL
jgi:hypothetical protein